MELILTYDIGTTAVKGILLDVEGRVLDSHSILIETYFDDEFVEQKPKHWYTAICTISKMFSNKFNESDIIGIVMSSQMQDVILIDKEGSLLRKAILYSDNRAAIQAKEIIKKFGQHNIIETTANNFDGTSPLAKLLWIKENEPQLYKKIDKVLFSAKEYCIYRLTNKLITDRTTASTTGMFNIRKKVWQTEYLETIGIPKRILPSIGRIDDRVGTVNPSSSVEMGIGIGTPVYVGCGDAGATTLSSGIGKPGEVNINLGTSGWVASVNETPIIGEGIFNLPSVYEETYITVIPFLNAGNVHKWITNIVAPEDSEDKYHFIEELFDKGYDCSEKLMFLPYLLGERFPIMDSITRGCFIGLTQETTKKDMVISCLEGVAFSIKQGIENLNISLTKITVVGGGAKFKVWCQILSDILEVRLEVIGDSEYAPAIAIASSVLTEQGRINNYKMFISSTLDNQIDAIYEPNNLNSKHYRILYDKYKKIYPVVKQLF